MPDIFVSPEEWTGFLQDVLEITVAAYLILKRENTVRSTWEEDTFTIQMETCMNRLSRHFCNKAIHLYHFFLTFDFAA